MSYLSEDEITLPLNVVRRAYSHSSHAFYCLECESEWRFDPCVSGAFRSPLYEARKHRCLETKK
jgi:hypothetical protein